MFPTNLNDRSIALLCSVSADALALMGIVKTGFQGAQVYDFNAGDLKAGRLFSEICLAGLADVQTIAYPDTSVFTGAAVQVSTNWPLQACMFSQYAGQAVAGNGFFAMGSGPWRSSVAKEALFKEFGYHEQASRVVVALETKSLTSAMLARICEISGLTGGAHYIVLARTRVQVGAYQVVSRNVETTLHKLHELKFDLRTIREAYGYAPLPPPSKDDLLSIGRTNDAILYGGFAQLWVDTTDDAITAVIEQLPSCASSSHGSRFIESFAAAGFDFYKMDNMLFAPAVVVIHNLQTGKTFKAGKFMPELLANSFASIEMPKKG